MMMNQSIVGDVLHPEDGNIASIEKRSRHAVDNIVRYQMQQTRPFYCT